MRLTSIGVLLLAVCSAADRGLARMSVPTGSFIAYAASPGQSADDGVSQFIDLGADSQRKVCG
jgi:hypothetical protein